MILLPRSQVTTRLLRKIGAMIRAKAETRREIELVGYCAHFGIVEYQIKGGGMIRVSIYLDGEQTKIGALEYAAN